ncbi:hypothetical protein [Streptacidiphilus rugosus]|uniref:hypothetical protein n=1 Tax=Streptacidiphilus rugosus TaxID=405783 RepID=UPI000565DE46|nr:hypothetical protein [Streptacidiphilus rugosus]
MTPQWPVPFPPGPPPVSRPRLLDRWWGLPLLATLAALPLIALAVGAAGLSAMAADPCNAAADCPHTFAAVGRSWLLLCAAALSCGFQWLPAYWVGRPMRILLGALPVLLALAAIVNAFATPVGR